MDSAAAQLPPLVRLFIGLRITEASRDSLARAQRTLAESGAHVSWVPGDNLHLSLAFLGDTDSATVDGIVAAMDEFVSTEPFAYEIEGVSFFGRPDSPKVVIACVTDSEPLTAIHRDIDAVLESLGMHIDSRPFKPHITLGRVRSSRGRAGLMKAIEAARHDSFGMVNAQSVCLFRSRLLPQGAVYSVLHETALNRQNCPTSQDRAT